MVLSCTIKKYLYIVLLDSTSRLYLYIVLIYCTYFLYLLKEVVHDGAAVLGGDTLRVELGLG